MDKVIPKYVLVQEEIKNAIKRGEIVDRLPGERTLAKEFGFSYMTIRKAVNNLVAEGLLYKVPMKGTFVAKSKTAKKPTNVFGYFLDGSIIDGLTSPYYSLIFHALEKQAAAHGYSLMYLSDVSGAGTLKHLDKVDGVIASCFPRIENVIHDINERVPVVVIDNSSSDKTIPSIIIDNYNAVRESVDYLYSLGHERIGFMTGLHDSDVGKNRYAGYVSSMHNHGLALEEDLIFKGNYSFESGTEGATQFLSMSTPPSAIMCSNDVMAIATVRKAIQLGFDVPDDLSVVGFDDISVASQIAPPLTTVAAPIADIAELAVRMLISLTMGERSEIKHIALPAKLIVRGTCRAIKSQVTA
jgi:DNA-binding LacI/PurR family transcriptional regulator